MGYLVPNLLVFVRMLRSAGMATDPERVRLCLAALERVGVRNRSTFYHAARTTLVYRREDLSIFDRAFAAFWWKPQDRPAAGRASERSAASRQPQSDPRGSPLGDRGYSATEVLRRKDFGELTKAEFEQVKRMVTGLGSQLSERLSRRQRMGSGRLPDHRRSWRANLRYGGEPVVQIMRRRKRKPRPLVVIADVSGSMEPYSELMLHFTHGLVRRLDQPVEAFVFSTRLSRLTRQLRALPAGHTLQPISELVPHWSSGTRIGEAIREFNRRWARRTLSHGAVVALISDGLDRGSVTQLEAEIAWLRRSCHRLLWLNPLLGTPDYRPLARGMRAALPYIDLFLPIHSLLSLAQFAARLLQLSSDIRLAPSRRFTTPKAPQPA